MNIFKSIKFLLIISMTILLFGNYNSALSEVMGQGVLAKLDADSPDIGGISTSDYEVVQGGGINGSNAYKLTFKGTDPNGVSNVPGVLSFENANSNKKYIFKAYFKLDSSFPTDSISNVFGNMTGYAAMDPKPSNDLYSYYSYFQFGVSDRYYTMGPTNFKLTNASTAATAVNQSNIVLNKSDWTYVELAMYKPAGNLKIAFNLYINDISKRNGSILMDNASIEELALDTFNLTSNSKPIPANGFLAIPGNDISFAMDVKNQYGTQLGFIDHFNRVMEAVKWTVRKSNGDVVWSKGFEVNQTTETSPIYVVTTRKTYTLAADIKQSWVYPTYDFTLKITQDISEGDYYVTAEMQNKEIYDSNNDFNIIEFPITIAPKGWDGDMAKPCALDVDIQMSGEFNAGTTITPKYKYFDYQKRTEGQSKISWLKASDSESIPTEFSNLPVYTLTENDLDSIIYLDVTPITIDGIQGKTVRSNYIVKQLPPIAKDVKIIWGENSNSKQLVVGCELNASFEYFDINSDAEGIHEYRWLRGDSKEIDKMSPIAGQVRNTYTVEDADIGKYITCEITPHTSKVGDICPVGQRVTALPINGPSVPEALNVDIIGNASAGAYLTGKYTYFHPNGCEEGKSILRWTCDNAILSTDSSYRVSDSDQGKTIFFEVVPISEKPPYEGNKGTKSITIAKTIMVASRGGGGGSYYPSKPTPTPYVPIFNDIEQHWAKNYIINMYKEKIIDKSEKNAFEPDKQISRAEFIAMAIRLLNIKNEDENIKYNDVTKNDWFYPYVISATKAKIISGWNGNFKPQESLTRAQLAKILIGIANAADIEVKSKTTGFSDIADNWAVEYIMQAMGTELMVGIDNNTFDPNGFVTRAQAATTISRVFELMRNKFNKGV